MRTLRVADLEAKPGEKVSGFVHIIGAEFGIPVTLICGEKEGETVLISRGVHNAEYVGIQAAMQLADELDPAKQPGETFKEGEVLGKICDYFGRELFVYRAKMGGIILYQTISLCIMKDTPMVSYGTWDEDTQGKIELGCEVCGNEKHKHGHHHKTEDRHHKRHKHDEER